MNIQEMKEEYINAAEMLEDSKIESMSRDELIHVVKLCSQLVRVTAEKFVQLQAIGVDFKEK